MSENSWPRDQYTGPENPSILKRGSNEQKSIPQSNRIGGAAADVAAPPPR
jgi:hypothetical protein